MATRKRTSKRSGIVGRAVSAGQRALREAEKRVPPDVRRQVERRREGLETMADDAIERALSRLRIPTRKDIDRINERLDRISAQLKRSGMSNGASSPRAGKSSAKPGGGASQAARRRKVSR